jgi:glutathione S-transferase
MSNIVLYHCSRTRAAIARWMLEEVGAPYTVETIDVRAGRGRDPEYLKVNPMGKVPAIRDGSVVVAKNAAIALYLADAYPKAGLAPAVGDPLRGAYLTWMVWGPGCLEPAVTQKPVKFELAPSALGWGDPELVVDVLANALHEGPYLLGDRFSAADVIVGSTLMQGMRAGAFPERHELVGYRERLLARPAAQRAEELEAVA